MRLKSPWLTMAACCMVGLSSWDQLSWGQEVDAAAAVQAALDTASSDDAPAADDQKKRTNEFEHFLRLRRDSRGRPIAMETSITRYRGVAEDGTSYTVDLIGVVHVGEKEYYEALNEQFKQYDALLYELVAPEGTRVPRGGRGPEASANPIAALQLGMKAVLGLEFQLDHIDYTVENMVHADMSPEEFAESMRNNEESVGKMILRAVGQSMAMQSRGGGSDAELLLSLFSSNRELKLRRSMAEQMMQIEGGMIIFEGKEGSTIIDHRNAKALEVLKREIAAGKRRIGIFYGAGHLPDMQRRLTSQFQMQRAGQFWLTAWNMAEPERPRR